MTSGVPNGSSGSCRNKATASATRCSASATAAAALYAVVRRHYGGRTSAGNPNAATLLTYLNTISSGTGFQGVPTKDPLGNNISSLNNNVFVFGNTHHYVVFRNQLAFTDVPRFFGEGSVGTNVS